MPSGLIFDIKRYAIHDGPGIRTTVFFKGCPLRCKWCHNPEGIFSNQEFIYRENRCRLCDRCIKACPVSAISRNGTLPKIELKHCDFCRLCVDACAAEALELVGRTVSVHDLMREIEKDLIFFDESGGGVTFSGGEPLMQIDFLDQVLTACYDKRIHSVVDTSGFVKYDVLERISDRVNLFLYDLKVIDPKIHKQYTGVDNQLILENLDRLLRKGQFVQIRIPVIPGVNDSPEQVADFVNFLKSYSPAPEIHLLPYHNWGTAKFNRLTETEVIIEDFSANGRSIEEISATFVSAGFRVQVGG